MTGTPKADPPAALPEVEAAYGTAIEEAFIAERGTPFFLGAKDWQLVREWLARGVPEETVVRAIKETFERRRARGTVEKVGGLAYCGNAVETRWEMERRGLAGSHTAGAFTEGTVDVASRLDALAARLSVWCGTPPPEGLVPEAAAKAAAAAVEALRAIPAAAGADEAEEALARVEKTLLAALGKAIGPPLDAVLAERVAAAAGDLSTLAAPARRKVEKALLARERRRLLELPALTLFGS